MLPSRGTSSSKSAMFRSARNFYALGSCNLGRGKRVISRSVSACFLSHILALHRPNNGAITTIPRATPNAIDITRVPFRYSSLSSPQRVSIVKFFHPLAPSDVRTNSKLRR
jgi:hypothetical protein